MKAVLAFVTCVLFLSGCSRSGDSSADIANTKTRVTLKQALIDARIAAIDNSQSNRSVVSLRGKLEREGRLTELELLGQSNLFFNPDFKLWVPYSESKDIAIVIRRDGRYVGIRFDWAFVTTQACPVIWAN